MERPVTTAGRDWSGTNPIRYPDPAIRILDPRFRLYTTLGHTPVQRLYTGHPVGGRSLLVWGWPLSALERYS